MVTSKLQLLTRGHRIGERIGIANNLADVGVVSSFFSQGVNLRGSFLYPLTQLTHPILHIYIYILNKRLYRTGHVMPLAEDAIRRL